MSLLFRTPHGSHLYGLNHANSDEDFYEVHSTGSVPRRAKQTIKGVDDLVRVSFNTFVEMCNRGTPQALEAMFSPVPEVEDEQFATFRANYYVDDTLTRATYRRTVVNFAVSDFKRRRHALRLALNYQEMSEHRRFNPRLSPEQAQFVTAAAASAGYLDTLTEVFPYVERGVYYEYGYDFNGE